MVLRKITIDNSVRYIPKSDRRETMNKFNLFREEVNQTRENKKNFQKIIKKLLKILQQEDSQNLNE